MDWISINEVKPPQYIPILVDTGDAFTTDFGTVQIAMRVKNGLLNIHMKPIIAEYWMPLPPPYKRGKHEAKHKCF